MATGRLSNFDIARLASNTSKKETPSAIIKRSATSSWIMGRPRPSLRLITDTAENSAAIITTKISSRQPARGSLALKKIFRRKKFAGGAGGIAGPEGAGVSGASLFILFFPAAASWQTEAALSSGYAFSLQAYRLPTFFYQPQEIPRSGLRRT